MSSTIGTCGHSLANNEYYSLALRNTGYDIVTDCEIKIIDYVVFCRECAQEAIASGDVLNTPEAEADWLSRPLC